MEELFFVWVLLEAVRTVCALMDTVARWKKAEDATPEQVAAAGRVTAGRATRTNVDRAREFLEGRIGG